MGVWQEGTETNIAAQAGTVIDIPGRTQSGLSAQEAKALVFGTPGSAQKGGLPWWRVALAAGSICLTSGLGLVAGSKMGFFDFDRKPTRKAQLKAKSAPRGFEDEPA